ncbi:hypothetical protein GT674_03160 [Blautia sp. BIOML-A1]|nr:hypothetical protein [Blautia sp. BIOML-A1]
MLGSVEPLSKKPPLQNQRFKWWEHVTYRTAGVREYWIVDPTKNFILVYDFEKNGSEQYTLQDSVKAGIYDDLTIDFGRMDI